MTKNNQSISDKIAKLDELVRWFDSEEFVLDQAIERFEAAKQLADDVTQDLVQLKNDITVIEQSFESDAA